MLVNWQILTLKLRAVKPLSRIAKEIGAQERHLNRLARGDVKEPRWSTAINLLNYYHDNIGDMDAIKEKY